MIMIQLSPELRSFVNSAPDLGNATQHKPNDDNLRTLSHLRTVAHAQFNAFAPW